MVDWRNHSRGHHYFWKDDVDFCNTVVNLYAARDICPLSKQVEKLEYRTSINPVLNVSREMPLGCLFMLNSLICAKNTYGRSLHVQNLLCKQTFQLCIADNLSSEVIVITDGSSV